MAGFTHQRHVAAVLAVACVLLLVGSCTAGASKPNIIFILADDVGWADVSFNGGHIHTQHLDELCREGVQLRQHHVQSTCTPSRAALMTGRYSANTGLIFAMLPGSLAGLRMDQPTMPEVLGKQGYHAHMVGKWHLGHAQWQQTPVGRGFRSHVGSYMWSMEVWPCGGWQLRHAGVA